MCDSTDTSATLNASVGGSVGIENGVGKLTLTPTTGAGVTRNRGSKETYHKLPPKRLLIASGTMNAGQGVFYKWKSSTQTSLEGLRECTFRFAVPKGWRGDWVEIHVLTLGHVKSYFSTRQVACGEVRPLAGLYLAGDVNAFAAASNLAHAQFETGTGENPVGDGGPLRHTAMRPPSDESSPPAPHAKCVLTSWSHMSSIFGRAEQDERSEHDSTAGANLSLARTARMAALSGP